MKNTTEKYEATISYQNLLNKIKNNSPRIENDAYIRTYCLLMQSDKSNQIKIIQHCQNEAFYSVLLFKSIGNIKYLPHHFKSIFKVSKIIWFWAIQQTPHDIVFSLFQIHYCGYKESPIPRLNYFFQRL